MKKKTSIKINKNLLWEYDLKNFDYDKNSYIVVERVIECGVKKDFDAIEQYYGKENLQQIVRDQVKYLNDIDMNFASHYYKVNIKDMKCYKIKKKHEKLLKIKINNTFQG
mgnify:CR=1 FL=1